MPFTDKQKKSVGAFFLISMFLLWSFSLYYFSPSGIVDMIGTKHSYLLLTLLAFLGGTSVLFPFPYYLLTISFGAAGLNPILLGLAAGAGTLLGDATTYYIAYHGRKLVPSGLSKWLNKGLQWLLKRHPAFVPLLAFFYASLTPLPDDVLMIPAGLSKYPFKKIAIGVGPGKVVFNTILALSGIYGWEIFFA